MEKQFEKIEKNVPTLEAFGLNISIYKNLENKRSFLIAKKKSLEPPIFLLIAIAFLLPFFSVFIFSKVGFWGSFGVAIAIGIYISVFIWESTEFFANVFSFGKYKRIEKEIKDLEHSTKEDVAEFEESFHDYFQERLDDFYSTKLYKKRSGTSAFNDSLEEFRLLLNELSHANEILLTKRFSLSEYEGYLLKRTWDHSFQKTSVDSEDLSKVTDFVKKASQVQIMPKVISPEEKYHIPRKIDWGKVSKNNIEIGIRGEEIAMDIEKEYLKSIGREDLANRIRHISKEDDTAGYDILSYFSDGNERYIEVKTTKSSIGAPYYISGNELFFLQKHLNDAFVYRVSIDDENKENVFLEISSGNQFLESTELVPVKYLVKNK